LVDKKKKSGKEVGKGEQEWKKTKERGTSEFKTAFPAHTPHRNEIKSKYINIKIYKSIDPFLKHKPW
jgi:hypothetical protein